MKAVKANRKPAAVSAVGSPGVVRMILTTPALVNMLREAGYKRMDPASQGLGKVEGAEIWLAKHNYVLVMGKYVVLGATHRTPLRTTMAELSLEMLQELKEDRWNL